MTEIDLEKHVEAFEQARQKSGGAELSDFLPPPTHSQYPEIAVELIRCEMELSWSEPGHRTLADYRERYPEIFRDGQNLDSVAFEEYRQRVLAGESVTTAEYKVRYGIRTGHWPDLNENVNPSEIDTEGTHDLVTGELTGNDRTIHRELADNFRASITRPELTTLQNRLHDRLRFISVALTLLLVYLALLVFMNPSEKVGLFLGSGNLIMLNGFCLTVVVSITVWLWVRRSISLTMLRIFETCLFGLILLELSAGLYSDLFIDHELREPMQDDHSLFHYSSSWCLPYFALIIAYGTLIPSSWWRCTLNVTVIAITPIVICTLAAGMEGELNQRFFESFLMQMLIWMVMAAAISIYGVHRLQTLERRFLRSGKLGKYRLIRQLAVGGMGSIYLAEDTLLGRECAVKLIRHTEANDTQLVARFEREVHAMAAISHPNVVQIFDYGHLPGGVFYYVMEYLKGPTLDTLVRRQGKLESHLVAQIMRDTCAALKSVHENNLVHRDIKPNNIMASRVNDLSAFKLLDFGLVKTTVLAEPDSQLTRQGAILGTPEFMSPEQAAGEPLDGRSDIYSLGAVAWYLLIGKPPFDKSTVVETLSAHLHESPRDVNKIHPEIPEQLTNVIVRCLAKDPADRFQNSDDLEQALAKVIE